LFLVCHLERLDELVAEAVALRLPGQLLLEHHAVGDVSGVEDDAVDVTVVAEIGDVSLEMAPLSEPVAHADDDLARLAPLPRGLDRSSVVVVYEPLESAPEQLAFGMPDHCDQRLADVPAVALTEDDHEV